MLEADIERLVKPAEKWDRKYSRMASDAIHAYSRSPEIAERRIALFLSEDCVDKFNLVNAASRAAFRRQLLSAASDLESELFQKGVVVMMATFVDRSWAFPDHEIEFDFSAAKQKIRNAFSGMDFIGAFEPGIYPDEKLKTASGTGSLVSFHAHVFVWASSITKLRRHKKTIERRFTAIDEDDGTYPVLHNMKTINDFRTVLRYITKMPVQGYSKTRSEGRVVQKHAPLTKLNMFRILKFLHRYAVFDAWFAGGEGSEVLKVAKAQAIKSVA